MHPQRMTTPPTHFGEDRATTPQGACSGKWHFRELAAAHWCAGEIGAPARLRGDTLAKIPGSMPNSLIIPKQRLTEKLAEIKNHSLHLQNTPGKNAGVSIEPFG